MKRLLPLLCLLAAACDSKPAPPAPPSASPAAGPVEPKKRTAEELLSLAEHDRVPALYEEAAAAFAARIAFNPKDAAAHEGAAIVKWRLSLMRGVPDADVAKEIEAAGDRPGIKALKALVRLVDGARTGGGWEPLGPRILKEVFAKAFPESASFQTDWVAIVRRPDGEIQQICESLAAAPDWPIAAAVRAALEGRDIPPPEKEGLLWILTALRLPPSEAMKMLESATSPDNGILMQAQAQLLAAEGRFTEATGRMTIAPIPVLRAAAHVAAGKPAPALESLEGELSPFGRVIKAAALLQTGTPAALKDLASIPEAGALGYVTFERGFRRLASGDREGLADLAKTKGDGPAAAAWYALGLWHAQDAKAQAELKQVDLSKLDPDLALVVQETIAYSHFAAGQEDEGNAVLIEAIKKTPTRDLYFKYSKMLRGNRQWKAVQELAQTVVRSMPADPEPWAARAEASFWLKNYDAAIQTVTFATEQKLDPKKLLRWRALSYEELGKTQEAHDDWNRLADLDSDMGEAFAHRGWMRARMGRWAEAKDDAEKSAGRGIDAWAQALMRFTLAAESLHGVPGEGEESDPAGRKEAALEHLRLAVKSGAVEPSDLDKAQDVLKPLPGSEEWKKIVESAAEKQKELKEDAKKGGFLGVMLDHSGGSVAVTGTYRKSGARAAGLAAGDVILEVEGRRVSHIQDVGSILVGREPGQEVKLKIERELRPKLKLVEVRTVTLSSRAVFEE